MIRKTGVLGLCILLSFSAAAEVPDDANQFTLICEWDDTSQKEKFQILGEGTHYQGSYKIHEDHFFDHIVINKTFVDSETGEPLSTTESGNEPKYLRWSYSLDRWTGRLKHAQLGKTDSLRSGYCKLAEGRLF